MRHYTEQLQPERIVLEHRVRQETMVILDPGVEEEERDSEEEHAYFDLQCGESLAIAVNRIGEKPFGIKRLVLHGLRVLSGRDGFKREGP
jgi:hypothetical protein